MRPILCIEIETGGYKFKDPLVAIGTCFFDPKAIGLVKTRFTFEFDVTQFEPRCVKEFWDKNKEKLSIFMNDKKVDIAEFANYLDEKDKAHPDLTILSDNPSFDIAFINYHFDTVLDRKPMNYRYDGTYRIIVDQNSYLHAMMPENEDPWIWDSKVCEKYGFMLNSNKDHLPENDAENILEMYRTVKKYNKN